MGPESDLRAGLSQEGQTLERFQLMALIEGQFDDRYSGTERPKWPVKMEFGQDGRPRPAPPDLPVPPITKAPGKLLVAGSARMWQNGIVRSPGNQKLLLNAVAALTLDPALLEVRAKQPTARTFPEVSKTTAFLGRFIPLGLIPLLIIVFGLTIGVARMRKREAWNRKHGR